MQANFAAACLLPPVLRTVIGSTAWVDCGRVCRRPVHLGHTVRMGRVVCPVFVGRTAALGRLAAVVEHARAARSSVVLVTGEAGVGKSRLVDEFAARTRATGTHVAIGGCVDCRAVGLSRQVHPTIVM